MPTKRTTVQKKSEPNATHTPPPVRIPIPNVYLPTRGNKSPHQKEITSSSPIQPHTTTTPTLSAHRNLPHLHHLFRHAILNVMTADTILTNLPPP